MERRINKKIEDYISEFKDNVKQKASELGLTTDNSLSQLVQYIYDYDRLVLTKDDFIKRKRVKNVVHLSDRCCAKRANGEQCTRKKKVGCDYCGTHTKGVPSSIMDDSENGSSSAIKVSQQNVNVWVQNIKGIEYFIDAKNNVYKHEDVIENSANPQIIAKCSKNESGLYSIEFL